MTSKTAVKPQSSPKNANSAKSKTATAVKTKAPVRKTAVRATRNTAKLKKLFILDTNVLLHDPYCTVKFDQHDVYLPFVTLEELDNKKAGTQDVNRNARQATRLLDEIVSQADQAIDTGFSLAAFSDRAQGRLLVQREALPFLDNEHLRKNDNMYLSVLSHLEKQGSHSVVVLVTKDLNLRIKAIALGFRAQDYLHDHAIDDADLIYKGIREVQGLEVLSSHSAGKAIRSEILREDLRINEFLAGSLGSLHRVIEVRQDTCIVETVADTTKEKNAILGVRARNVGQRAALSLLNDPNVDLVALLGTAGTGKTLLAMASALSQIREGLYDSVLFTRAHVPLGDDIGYLPGSEEEKMAPWMGAMYDNIEVLAELAPTAAEGHVIRTQAQEVVEVRAMTFMRGRSFQRKVVIIDEAQNLTPKQVKALVTRAGDGTKIIALGNLAQIDSPYLSETSSGLSFLVERFKGWEHFGALVLEKGERSRLANAANERL